MKTKMLNAFLIITSLIGYLEWGHDNSSFLFQAEYKVIIGLFTNIKSTAHPFTLVPLLGQLLIVITLFQKEPSKVLTYIGMICLGLLLGLMLFIGISALNFKILISTLPFFITMVLVTRSYRKK